MGNRNVIMNKAKINKKDEFYTSFEDIEREVSNYKDQLKNKIVYCNCDNPEESYFVKYFEVSFDILQLKKVIFTFLNKHDSTYKLELIKTNKGLEKIKIPLKQNGDFRSDECIELLKEADVIVTNPPFSLFREYINLLITYNKKFLIVGNQNAITYKPLFNRIKNNEIWLGYGFKGNAGYFINKYYEDYATSSNHREGMIRVSGVVWFTNLETSKRKEIYISYREYDESFYKIYSNYNAIEVSKSVDIPENYKGLMGVPITFLQKYNPDQFEIVELLNVPVINGKNLYKRIIIRWKK